MAIEPETKNWTWVLERECEQCGFDARTIAADDIARLSRDAGEPWSELLAHPLARMRPNDSTWSALEYGCHVRDVFGMTEYRLGRMLNEDDPRFANWDQDETAVAERYELQNPNVVAGEIVATAAIVTGMFETVTGAQWSRPSMRSDGSRFTIESFGKYVLHDLMHHIVDVRRGYAALSGD